jgi:hypothetical protein
MEAIHSKALKVLATGIRLQNILLRICLHSIFLKQLVLYMVDKEQTASDMK